MTNMNQAGAEKLIQVFLEGNEAPSAADWRKLTDAHPEHASAFVEAALIRAAGDAAEMLSEEYQLDEQLVNSSVSRALNLFHRSHSVAQDDAAAKVAAIRAPAARKELAVKVGIGPHVSLLSGVLVGRTSAPRRLLAALAAALDVQIFTLREYFDRTFESSSVPSYKWTVGKPNVPIQPVPWEQAVRGLSLDAAETERLLRFSEED